MVDVVLIFVFSPILRLMSIPTTVRCRRHTIHHNPQEGFQTLYMILLDEEAEILRLEPTQRP